MKIGKFFTFTISGEYLNPNEIKEKSDLPCEIYLKGETILAGKMKVEVLQKTNRWVYSAKLSGKSSVSVFLTKHLEIIFKKLSVLKKYIENFDSSIEIVLYAGNKTDITLTPKQIKLLDKIGVYFSISFC